MYDGFIDLTVIFYFLIELSMFLHFSPCLQECQVTPTSSKLWKKLAEDVQRSDLSSLLKDVASSEETRDDFRAYVSRQIQHESSLLCSSK